MQHFLTDPQYLAESKMTTFSFEDDEEEQPTSYEGMGSHMISVDEGVATVSVDGSLSNSYSPALIVPSAS